MRVGPEQVLVRDAARYIAHPHLARLADGSWLLVATSAPRRAVTLHPPLDPAFITIAMRSSDDGHHWSAPEPVPGPDLTGAECSGLTALPDGAVLLDQWRFRWFPEGAAPADEAGLTSAAALRAELHLSPELDDAGADDIAWNRGGGTLAIWRSDDGGRRWRALATPATAPFAGGYGLRGGIVMDTGEVLLPLTDPPHYRRVFLLRSRDGGQTWGVPEPVAEAEGRAFEEPAPLALGGTRMLMLLRENEGRRLMATRSEDAGVHWSPPQDAGLDGFPAHLLRLADGRVAAVTAVREPPGRILLTISEDEGARWDREGAIALATDLGTRDLGYPTAALTRDGQIFVAYYRRDHAGVTGLYARRVQPHPH